MVRKSYVCNSDISKKMFVRDAGQEQRRSQDFCWGGAPGRCHPLLFPSSPEADQIQWGGGGVVTEIFQDPRERTRFSGGVVVADIFPVTSGGDQSNSLNSGTFFYISGSPQRNNINSLQTK